VPNTNPEKHKAYCKAYRKRNLEKVKADIRRYHREHKEELKIKAIARRHANPEPHRIQTKAWRKAHLEFYRVAASVRRTRKTEAGGSFTVVEWRSLCKKYGNRCLSCGKRWNLTADHVIPVSKGGTSDIGNIQPLCGPCNSIKSDKSTDYRKIWTKPKKVGGLWQTRRKP
jgi:5-methylcytosine-specific restriction endonuclease McrA